MSSKGDAGFRKGRWPLETGCDGMKPMMGTLDKLWPCVNSSKKILTVSVACDKMRIVSLRVFENRLGMHELQPEASRRPGDGDSTCRSLRKKETR